MMADRYSNISIRETGQKKQVKISSESKPEIDPSIIDKWQSLIDVAAKIAKVPAGLIMKLNEDTIEVFIRSRTKGNPYKAGEEAKLDYGLYCETVIGTQKKLLVPDATKSPVWKDNNPDVDLNIISYLGFPINWPDGEVFGTVCLLDNKENQYSQDYIDFLNQVKLHIETDLQLLISKQELEEANATLEQLNTVKSRFLSLISHDIRSGIGSCNEFLKLTLENFDKFDKSELTMMLETLSQSADSAYITLENLLDWSKRDLLQLKPHKTEINIISLLNKLLNYFQQAIILKEIEVVREFYSKEVFINADEDMLTSGIRNILSNAIKYNIKGGKVFLRVNSVGDKIRIEIEDTGIGMDKDTLKGLFTYDNAHKAEGKYDQSGAGIGLMITKDFLDKNGAVVKVESKIEKGTRFIITL
jgi:signal transduction histidine kinase